MNKKPIGLWLVVALYCLFLYSNSKFTYQLIFEPHSLAEHLQYLYSQMPSLVYVVYVLMSVFYAAGIIGLLKNKKYGLYCLVTSYSLNLLTGLYSIFAKNSLQIYDENYLKYVIVANIINILILSYLYYLTRKEVLV